MARALASLRTREAGSAELAASYEYCRRIAERHSKTFYFSSLFMAPPQRRAIWAVYAFCRTADNIVDTSAPSSERVAALHDWHQRLLAAYAGDPRGPIMTALFDAVQRFGIPIQPALDLLEGARRDVTVLRYETYAELLEYCYLVASTVGLLTAPILGYVDGALPYGIALGRAMQMTNILRDVGEDARLGRIYLPAEDLRRFGYAEDDLLAGRVNAQFVALMRFEIERVRSIYREAEPGIALLSRSSRRTVRIALAVYRGILRRIEQNDYDVFTRRAFVPLQSKLFIALGTLTSRP